MTQSSSAASRPALAASAVASIDARSTTAATALPPGTLWRPSGGSPSERTSAAGSAGGRIAAGAGSSGTSSHRSARGALRRLVRRLVAVARPAHRGSPHARRLLPP